MKKILLLNFLLYASVAFSQVTRVDAITITVSDLDEALIFYTQVLPFKKISETEVYGEPYEKLKGVFGIRYRKARLQLGEEFIELTDFLTGNETPVPYDSRSNDLWFQHIAIVVRDMDSAYAVLRKHHVTHVSTGPQTLPKSIPAATGVRAFYFRDPDGHNLELIYFPKGKGNLKWQASTRELFLGIDHTAIGVSNTVASRIFYGDLLGVKFQGESFNFGDEQEHLNNVFGASLHISGNRTDEGPGIEFLEYLAPKTGRPYPSDERSDDLIHWETIMISNQLDQLFESLKKNGVIFISPSIIKIPAGDYRYRRGFYVRDPDGHAVGIFEL